MRAEIVKINIITIANLYILLKRTDRWLILLLCLGVAIALTCAQVTLSLSVSSKNKEIRGVWLTNVSSAVLYTPWGINRALNQLARLKFNTIYPVVWNRGATFYPSAVAKKVTGRDRDFLLQVLRLRQDTLAQIVKQSHRHGLRVIPWFEYGFMAPANSALVKRHPDWLTSRRDRSKIFQTRENDPNLPKASNPELEKVDPPVVSQGVWLNPFHPQVQQFILNLIVEVVTKYDIDGIQLDDHFGLPNEFGYDAFTIGLYQQEHQGKSPPSNPVNSEWLRWRADKITKFMQQVFVAVKAVKPNCLVTLSPNPQYFAYKATLQDWRRWVQLGLIEELVCQVYRSNRQTFLAELEQSTLQAARQKIPVAIGILTGSLSHPVSIEQIKRQVQLVRDRGYSGVSFFYWESLWGYIAPESPQERRDVFKSLFSPPKLSK